ncbi:cytochrome P450 [Streptomyces olivaceiscleroticus]|uniref:Cytochrome P450 n=1 Tax=Streptomyces olivaceiscleroticus TaxID=68245 RepID=A0ABN0ZKE5_9ACTN
MRRSSLQFLSTALGCQQAAGLSEYNGRSLPGTAGAATGPLASRKTCPWERLRQKDRGLLPRAVNELTRRCGSIQMAGLRHAAEDLKLVGTHIRQGDAVQPILVSANRDPRRLDAPERLDLTRQAVDHEEEHVGFSRGARYCLGVALARRRPRWPSAACCDAAHAFPWPSPPTNSHPRYATASRGPGVSDNSRCA